MSHFGIRCRKCGEVLRDAYCAFCEHCLDALLVTEYKSDGYLRTQDKIASGGIWRYEWLPVHEGAFKQPSVLVYRSEGLAGVLGLEELYIAFNGYWPQRGADMQSCTFKEFEAAVVIQNARENGMEGLVAASAGNTARAFAHMSLVSGFPVIIVVPSMCLEEMWYLDDSNHTPTLALTDGDYSDAIETAKRMALTIGMPFEGGVKNIAKRDGLGVVMLEAVDTIGRLPGHYFQAVGSGTGAIAAWEMAERFLKSGAHGSTLPRLHLVQNLPFAPMVKAWHRGQRELQEADLDPELIPLISTRVLSNRYPAYGCMGGVYDALIASGGNMYGVTNDEVVEGVELFERTEGIDIVPAAGAAVAALKQASGSVSGLKTETVLLNITGGGERTRRLQDGYHRVKPIYISKNITETEMERLACEVLRKN